MATVIIPTILDEYAAIADEVLLQGAKDGDFQVEDTFGATADGDPYVTHRGHLTGSGTAVKVSMYLEDGVSLRISAHTLYGTERFGYTTDILDKYLSEETVREYCEQALTKLYKR